MASSTFKVGDTVMWVRKESCSVPYGQKGVIVGLGFIDRGSFCARLRWVDAEARIRNQNSYLNECGGDCALSVEYLRKCDGLLDV